MTGGCWQGFYNPFLQPFSRLSAFWCQQFRDDIGLVLSMSSWVSILGSLLMFLFFGFGGSYVLVLIFVFCPYFESKVWKPCERGASLTPPPARFSSTVSSAYFEDITKRAKQYCNEIRHERPLASRVLSMLVIDTRWRLLLKPGYMFAVSVCCTLWKKCKQKELVVACTLMSADLCRNVSRELLILRGLTFSKSEYLKYLTVVLLILRGDMATLIL